MKTLLALSALLFCAAAHAETVTLGTEPCAPTNFCSNVPNDKGIPIDYISVSTHGRLTLQADGVMYDSGLYAVAGLNQTNAVVYAPDGSSALVTLVFTVTTKPCFRSGRVTVCPRFVTLDRGTLVLP